MQRTLVVLGTATVLCLGGGVGLATAAMAGNGPNPHSQDGQCTSAAAGKHLGWEKQANNERRNVGGTCPAQ
jgi:hypothetical protein